MSNSVRAIRRRRERSMLGKSERGLLAKQHSGDEQGLKKLKKKEVLNG